ncbi:transcriptional regulator with XRE-family HTH domain [Kibdelosporangium banguiense]|uniref:Transcriptional regulator with XRE-family HTH domain n=1 Tax=Kibdelosporangium banguiense TaxID=1365924 RepID=A0ABS4TKX1_9PSEU|nr:helix-turn-helix transcriptional regulator [Kibdelosporangium banguiense]MBP2324620.1 transcriptional regulator with XRE-family HTH domain [Kibdelosporangium banguiense]
MSGQLRTAERIQVGATLKRMRTEVGLGREAAAERLGYTITTISNMEQGRTRVRHADLAALLDLYHAPDDQADDLKEVNREAHRSAGRVPGGGGIQAHQRRAADLIKAARTIRYYSPEMFPGVLQTRDYARAILAPTGHLAEKLEIYLNFRLTLGAVLTRPQQPLGLWVVVSEAALHKNIGGRKVMSSQLQHVAQLCRAQQNVTVQILPLDTREHYSLGATVTIYKFDHKISEIASADTTMGELFFDRDPLVVEAIRNFEDVKLKAFDPLTSVDMIEDFSNRRRIG